jgi:hypothetical protein
MLEVDAAAFARAGYGRKWLGVGDVSDSRGEVMERVDSADGEGGRLNRFAIGVCPWSTIIDDDEVLDIDVEERDCVEMDARGGISCSSGTEGSA